MKCAGSLFDYIRDPSLRSSERGLKFASNVGAVCVMSVAPFVGAWIEIIIRVLLNYRKEVAPFVGAWIEIYSEVDMAIKAYVAPFVGAWIEIDTY